MQGGKRTECFINMLYREIQRPKREKDLRDRIIVNLVCNWRTKREDRGATLKVGMAENFSEF